jgi:hypothetical protein
MLTVRFAFVCSAGKNLLLNSSSKRGLPPGRRSRNAGGDRCCQPIEQEVRCSYLINSRYVVRDANEQAPVLSSPGQWKGMGVGIFGRNGDA